MGARGSLSQLPGSLRLGRVFGGYAMWNHNSRKPATIQYRVSGAGPDALLIHGWMVSGRVWDALLPLLDGYRLIVPDLRGSGESPAGASAGIEDHLADLSALCDKLDLHDAHLVGHSMGGQLAALLAALSPERFRSLTLMNPVPVDGLPFPEELQPLFHSCGGNREQLGRIVDMSCLRLSADARERMLDDAENTDAATVSASFDAFRLGLPGTSLKEATMPATVIATDDPFLPAAFLDQAVASRLPDARLVHLAGPGHYPQAEAPRETADLLRSLWS